MLLAFSFLISLDVLLLFIQLRLVIKIPYIGIKLARHIFFCESLSDSRDEYYFTLEVRKPPRETELLTWSHSSRKTQSSSMNSGLDSVASYFGWSSGLRSSHWEPGLLTGLMLFLRLHQDPTTYIWEVSTFRGFLGTLHHDRICACYSSLMYDLLLMLTMLYYLYFLLEGWSL